MKYKLMLRELREQQGLSQRQVADKIGVTPGAVAHWELGHTKLSMDSILALADLLDCTVDQLLGREPPGRTSA